MSKGNLHTGCQRPLLISKPTSSDFRHGLRHDMDSFSTGKTPIGNINQFWKVCPNHKWNPMMDPPAEGPVTHPGKAFVDAKRASLPPSLHSSLSCLRAPFLGFGFKANRIEAKANRFECWKPKKCSFLAPPLLKLRPRLLQGRGLPRIVHT